MGAPLSKITILKRKRQKRLKYTQQERNDLAKVKQDGHTLEHVKKQTEEICLAAVKQYRYALEYVKDPKMQEKIRQLLQK